MNLSSPSKLITALTQLEPKELSKLTMAMKKEQKESALAGGSLKKLSALSQELAGAVSQFSKGINDVAKAANAAAKPTKEDAEKVKKSAAQTMENWQGMRIKMLEAKIAEVEKELASLRSWLATAKQQKPSNWFK